MKTKKELKEDYLNKTFPMGVFQIRNKTNGKVFIEGSINLDAIWNRHRTQLKWGGHPNAGLQKDWNAMGEDNFVFEILETIEPGDDPGIDYAREIKTLETMMIEERQPFDEKGYHKRKPK